MKKIPISISNILKEAPLGYGMVVLSDYKSKRKTIKQLQEEFIQFQNNNGNK